jgi:hypothetical protein
LTIQEHTWGINMSKKDFDAFIKQHKSTEKETDWEARKKDWLDNINNFYSLVQKWFYDYKIQKQVTLEFVPYRLNEEYIGSYESKKLHLKIANQEIVFIPIGTRLFGSKGRIDMEGSAGKVRFLLADKHSTKPSTKVQIYDGDKNIDWAWKIATPPPTIQLIDLNEESFFDALMEVING